MNQQVNDFFLRYQQANSTSDVLAIGALYADTFMFAGVGGVRAVDKGDFLKVVPQRKAHFSSMGLSDTQLESVKVTTLDSQYLLAKVEWGMTLKDASRNKSVQVSSTYVLLRGNGDSLSIVLQIDHQDLASVIKEQQITLP